MKVLTGLLTVTMFLGLMVGCQQTIDVIYKEVSVGSMRLIIPTTWQRPDDVKDMVEELQSDMGLGMEQYIQADYYLSSSELFDNLGIPRFNDEIGVILMVMEMSKMSESEGIIWEGWDYLLESQDITKEDIIPSLTAGFIGEGLEEVTQHTFEHTIYGSSALEATITGKQEGEPVVIHLLLVFAEDDLGMIMMIGEESISEKYEDTWYDIRDSVQF